MELMTVSQVSRSLGICCVITSRRASWRACGRRGMHTGSTIKRLYSG